MREIKFRAWDNVAKCMYSAGEESSIFFELASGGITAYDLTEEENSPLYKMEHLKYQQFTGLKDMNNEEIYEGDLIEIEFVLSKQGKLGPFPVTFEYFQWNADELTLLELVDLSKQGKISFEVSGNIYENPELLS